MVQSCTVFGSVEAAPCLLSNSLLLATQARYLNMFSHPPTRHDVRNCEHYIVNCELLWF